MGNNNEFKGIADSYNRKTLVKLITLSSFYFTIREIFSEKLNVNWYVMINTECENLYIIRVCLVNPNYINNSYFNLIFY